MKKFLRFSLVALFVVLGMSNAKAGSIVFADLGLKNGVQYSDPFDGGDFTVTFAGGGNDGKYYDAGTGIRVYGNGTMTIAAKDDGTLKKIVITFDGTYKPEAADVVNTGTYDFATGTWTGDAAAVVFTRPTGSGHWRVQKIEVGDDASSDVPTEGQTAETAITVERALEIAAALGDNKSTSSAYYIKGYAIDLTDISVQHGNATFTVADDLNASDKLTAYRLNGLGNKPVTNAEFMEEGDEVIVYGQLKKFVKEDETTLEVTGGYVYSVNGETEDTTPNPEDAITKGKTADSPMTVDEALAYINAFPDAGFTTTNQYYVSGTVSEVTEISTANGNATFNMGNLVVYRAKGLENKNIKDENYLKANDEVIVLAKLQKFVKESVATPELSSGYIYSLNGETEEQVDPIDPTELEGDGTKEKPFTVGDLKQMTEENYPTDAVWVKGVIIGSAASATSLKPSDNQAASNIAIAAAITRADAVEFIPVELKDKTDFRTKLNVLDNSENIGKEVLLKGTITKYFGTTGIKGLVEAEFNGEAITGISALTIDTDVNAPMYNLKGERVDANYRGVVIKGGKKTIQK